MKALVIEAIQSYKTISSPKPINFLDENLNGISYGLNMKLWRRFGKVIQLYKDGDSYQYILQSYFGAKSSNKELEIIKKTKILILLSIKS